MKQTFYIKLDVEEFGGYPMDFDPHNIALWLSLALSDNKLTSDQGVVVDPTVWTNIDDMHDDITAGRA